MRGNLGFTLIELLIVVAIIAIVAAIAVPSLLRARISANEAAAIGDVRTVISAEATYYTANSSYYGVISCLGTGASACITGYTGPTFLDALIVSLNTKSGYARTFSTDTTSAGGLTGAANAYCYGAYPATAISGVRSFAGDFSAVIGTTNFNTPSCCTGSGARDTTLCPVMR